MIDLAFRAGQIMTENFALNMKREWKSDETPITITDTKINDLVVSSFGRDYPQIRVISEEGNNTIEEAEFTVFCDPVDGTIPFSLGIPVSTFCISMFQKGKPTIGVIYDPFQDRMWFAKKNCGTFLRTTELCGEIFPSRRPKYERVYTSKHQTLNRANISMIWWKGSPYHLHNVCLDLMEAGGHWINLASLAIFGGLIASGTIEGSIFPGKNAWETGAMQIIIEEAGGKVTDIFGNEMSYGPRGQIQGHIISNSLIHDELVKLVAKNQIVARI